MPDMHHQEEDEQWRDEDEGSSAVETGCCSSQSIPILAHALSLFNSFPAPHDALFGGSGSENGMAMVDAGGASAELVCHQVCSEGMLLADSSPGVARCLIPVESCAKNEEGKNNNINNNTHNSSSDQHNKKIRSKNWTRLEMLKLIRLRTDYEPKFAGGGKKMELWDEISEALNREGIPRDGQQCRDKWEKLSAGYKEVRDGNKLKEDFTLFDVLHPLLSGKVAAKKDTTTGATVNRLMHVDDELHQPIQSVQTGFENHRSSEALYEDEAVPDANAATTNATPSSGRGAPRKKRRLLKYVPVTDVAVVQSLLETVVSKQQRFFRELLESMERREQLRDQVRQEREEQWRAEDRAQRTAFNNAMICLAQKLVGNGSEKVGGVQVQQLVSSRNVSVSNVNTEGGQKKRSKNWKRAEVLQLIRVRGEMDLQFTSGTRRAAVWDELSEALMSQGIPRDGKQCREKWDKLTAAYKDVSDGIKEAGDMPYYAELSAALKRPVHVDELKASPDVRATPPPGALLAS